MIGMLFQAVLDQIKSVCSCSAAVVMQQPKESFFKAGSRRHPTGAKPGSPQPDQRAGGEPTFAGQLSTILSSRGGRAVPQNQLCKLFDQRFGADSHMPEPHQLSGILRE